MKHILIIAIPALMLAGCAKTYDQAAVPGANVAMHISSERCEARRAVNDLKTYSDLERCQLAAEREFAVSIHLKNMDTFESYAVQMQALAADRDAHRVTAEQAELRADAIRSAFLADCGCKPKTTAQWAGNYMPPQNGMWNAGTNISMGQGNHAMGPGPQP